MTDADTRQLLLVANEAELYGIDVPAVQEIRTCQPLTRLPHAPAHVLGVLSVSGQILPVIDLRCRLGGAPTVTGPRHVIVMVKEDDAHCGILVDAASEIAVIANDAVEPLPSQVENGCLAGIAHFSGLESGLAGRPVAILDIKAIARFSLEMGSTETPKQEDLSYV